MGSLILGLRCFWDFLFLHIWNAEVSYGVVFGVEVIFPYLCFEFSN